MKASVLHFTPRAELDAADNVAAFIELCKRSEVFQAARQFGNDVWDIGRLRGKNVVHRVIFSTMEAASSGNREPIMPRPFLDFAKSALIYLHDKEPVESQAIRIAALRFLEAALRAHSLGSRPTAVNEEVLDTAVSLAREHLGAAAAYRSAGQLAKFAELMRSKGFITLRQAWSHGLRKPEEHNSRISEDAIKRRQEKMPSAATLRALGGIFRDALEPRDVLVASVMALMLCAPERINETLRLRRNCIVEGQGQFKGELGLRWAGSKGADDTVKWIPTQMQGVAREAISKLLRITSHAHEIAAWYTKNPQKLFLQPVAEHLRGKEVLTREEISLILWGDEGAHKMVLNWGVYKAKIPLCPIEGQLDGFRFEDVERAVIAMLPTTFPYVPGAPELSCEEAMSLFRVNEMHSDKATYVCMFTTIDHGAISKQLGQEGRESIFERFEYTEDDGSPIRMNTHQLRHYLNMLAQTGGLSDTDIALFSGRKDVSQNQAYDHMTSDEVQAPIRLAIKQGFTANIVPRTSDGRVARAAFKGLGVIAGYTTKFGWCQHNFAAEPCHRYRDCVNCEEHVCIKGEREKEDNLRLLKAETNLLLGRALQVLGEEDFKKDAWVAQQTATLEKVNALLAIIENPEVPGGAAIRLEIESPPLVTTDEVALRSLVSTSTMDGTYGKNLLLEGFPEGGAQTKERRARRGVKSFERRGRQS